jgi:hypothetical protein
MHSSPEGNLMSHTTIDTAVARRMVEASAIRGAVIVGLQGGWGVMLKVGLTEKPLGTQRTDKPRTWTSLDTCMAYLRDELKIVHVDGLDASNYSAAPIHTRRRQDAAERMKAAHEAAADTDWLRDKVGASRAGLKVGTNRVIPAEEWAAKRAKKSKPARTT